MEITCGTQDYSGDQRTRSPEPNSAGFGVTTVVEAVQILCQSILELDIVNHAKLWI